MYNVNLIRFIDSSDTYKLIHQWCSEKFVYEWFEQRILSYDEIVRKYKNKLLDKKQELFLIECNKRTIGLVQLYKYNDFTLDELRDYKNIYEYDIFIGNPNYLHKGIGSKIIDIVNKLIYDKYLGDCIIIRPFKKNISAIKCYQKNGFKIIKEYNGKDTIGNDEKIVVLVKLLLVILMNETKKIIKENNRDKIVVKDRKTCRISFFVTLKFQNIFRYLKMG